MRGCAAALALLAATAAAQKPPHHPPRPKGAPMAVRILPAQLVETLGARCMDGSAAGYYWRQGEGENASKVVAYIQGGGECRTESECIAWHDGHASNSSQWAPTQLTDGDGEMDTDCKCSRCLASSFEA